MILGRACLSHSPPSRWLTSHRAVCGGYANRKFPPPFVPILFFLLVFSSGALSQTRSQEYGREGPIIRVSLEGGVHRISLQLSGTYKLAYEDVTIASVSDASISISYSEHGTPTVELPNQELQFFSPIIIEPASIDNMTSTPTIAKDGVGISHETYPGMVEVIPESSGTFRLLNLVNTETYLRGVVPNELVNDLTPDELQACMAQAVAARNYAFFRMSQRDSNDFDVYGDTRDQVYSGIQGYKPMTDSAVEMTRGILVDYQGQPARCFFHSTCGGHTASVQNVWQGQPALPYLSGVSDIDPATGKAFCAASPKFRWTTTFTGAELDRLVRQNLALASPIYAGQTVRGGVEDLKVVNRFKSGRVDTLEIQMKDGRKYIVRGDRIRYLLQDRGKLLYSSLFNLRIVRERFGKIDRIVLNGRGDGHGVGMCQWGAIGMSKAGFDYKQILEHYYPGTEVVKKY